MSVKEKEFE
jgi:hypothetical protein